MDFPTIDEHLRSLPHASKAFHERWGWMVYWVGGKQFACEFTAKPTAKPRMLDGTCCRSNAIRNESAGCGRRIRT